MAFESLVHLSGGAEDPLKSRLGCHRLEVEQVIVQLAHTVCDTRSAREQWLNAVLHLRPVFFSDSCFLFQLLGLTCKDPCDFILHTSCLLELTDQSLKLARPALHPQRPARAVEEDAQGVNGVPRDIGDARDANPSAWLSVQSGRVILVIKVIELWIALACIIVDKVTTTASVKGKGL